MKRISLVFIILLISALLFCSCELSGNYVYELNESEDGYTVSVILRNPLVSLTDNIVPSEYKGLPVTAIKSGAFAGWSGVVGVNIPGSVRTVGKYAFGTCEYLNYVNMFEGVERIEAYAFANCMILELVSIPSTVKYIGNGAFGLCITLNTISYAGTIAEWNAIEKSEGWCEGAAINGYFAISCTDGNVIINTSE